MEKSSIVLVYKCCRLLKRNVKKNLICRGSLNVINEKDAAIGSTFEIMSMLGSGDVYNTKPTTFKGTQLPVITRYTNLLSILLVAEQEESYRIATLNLLLFLRQEQLACVTLSCVAQDNVDSQ